MPGLPLNIKVVITEQLLLQHTFTNTVGCMLLQAREPQLEIESSELGAGYGALVEEESSLLAPLHDEQAVPND